MQVQNEQFIFVPDTQNQPEAKFDLMTMMKKSQGKEIYSLEDHIAGIVVSFIYLFCLSLKSELLIMGLLIICVKISI